MTEALAGTIWVTGILLVASLITWFLVWVTGR